MGWYFGILVGLTIYSVKFLPVLHSRSLMVYLGVRLSLLQMLIIEYKSFIPLFILYKLQFVMYNFVIVGGI